MKKFVNRIILFCIPVICWIVIEGFIPRTTFAYRPWEALSFKTTFGLGKRFHTNSRLQMTSVGDLCYYTKNEVEKTEGWIIDKLGYRNDSFIKNPEILLVGDSYTVGTGLDQNSTITNKIKTVLNNKVMVYNLAPATFSSFEYYTTKGILNKPKILILSASEKELPNLKYEPISNSSLKESFKEKIGSPSIANYLDRCFRLYSIQWVKARINGSHGKGVPGLAGSNMFFLIGKGQSYDIKEVEQTVNTLKLYKSYCDSRGIRFLFLPMPNKETVYFDKVPLNKQPDYLFVMDSLLQEAKIETINTLRIYNE